MAEILIKAPRWKDRKVLIAEWKIAPGNNIIKITCTRADGSLYYPEPANINGIKLKSYPLVEHNHGKMREVPLDDLWDE